MMLPLYLKRHRFLLLILATSILAGCLGTNPVTPTRLYVLNPVEYKTSLVSGMDDLPLLSVEIASLRLPQYLEKPQIITRSSQNRLVMAEYHQWGGNLGKNMIRVLAQNLSRLLSTPNIAMAPFRPSPPPDLRVDVEVMQFEADHRGQVKFSAQWRLSRGKDGKTLVTRLTDLKKEVPGEPEDFDVIVPAMGDLVGDLSHIIAREILNQRAGTPGQ